MAPRPKNPPPDRREDILEAALRVYAQKGYAAATNADIAREAGVTAAALYYYFPSKADLFKAALTQRKSVIFPNVAQMGDQLLEFPPDQVLPFVIRNMAAFLSDERTQIILRIVLSEGQRNPEVVEIYQSDVIGQVGPIILKYLNHHMEKGNLKQMDPRIFALLLNGSLMAAVILRDILKLNIAQGMTDEILTEGIIETLLPGMLGQNKE